MNDIPKGSRLAVSTSLLSCLIAVCMRATSQIHALTGGLEEEDRRLVAARAILGEWLGGSGGGWQDSGGVWPGIKLIHGVRRGGRRSGVWHQPRVPACPVTRCSAPTEVSPAAREQLQQSLVLVHGGMAQDVGPILEMVTEKYLLRSEAEWQGRREAIRILDEISDALKGGDIRAIGSRHAAQLRRAHPDHHSLGRQPVHGFAHPPARAAMGEDFWGFWMLGGMSGGGMGFLFSPARKAAAQERLGSIMRETRAAPGDMPCPSPWTRWSTTSPSTSAAPKRALLTGDRALLPADYYTLAVPALLRTDSRLLSTAQRRRTRPLQRGLPHVARILRHGATPFRAHAAARAGGAGPRNAEPRQPPRRARLRRLSSTSRFRPTCAPAGSAWRRTACPPTARSKTPAPGALFDASGETAAPLPRDRPRALARGRRSGGFARRRHRNPLDQGRRRGQGA